MVKSAIETSFKLPEALSESQSLTVIKQADIAVFDLNKPWVFKKENIKSKSKNTAIEDRKLQGKVEKTFINGDLVFSE